MTAPDNVHAVDPARLRRGQWDAEGEIERGEGDIVASYSADRIGMGEPLRRPFTWRGGLWVCTSLSGAGDHMTAQAYRLQPVEAFSGVATTYEAKTEESEAARNDPLGFYHGMAVTIRGQTMVLSGPPRRERLTHFKPAPVAANAMVLTHA